ncbi:hypothetical protein L9F63_004467 [Diploptera punctata]|uniref:Odorant receptor n=1 Tax=Diploptera punctata TaxID=6984 RepID=A0AAD8E791_DIPPU|nr:hypothetical protein L9F63_004467 [Diploptera punctata]
MLSSTAYMKAFLHITEDVVDRDSPLKEEAWKKMPFVIYLPIVDVNNVSGRFVILFFQLFLSTALLITAVAVDLTCLALINQVSAQFRYLMALLENMDEEHNEWKLRRKEICGQKPTDLQNFQENIEGEEDEQWYENYLKECIHRHQALLAYVDDLNDLMNLPVFIQIGNVPILVCLTGFNITEKDKSIEQSVMFIAFFSASVYKLFLYCWFGQNLINTSEQVQETVYGCSWYLRRERFKKLVPMMLMRSSRCAKMSASVFFDLSFETFSSFMNTAYSYITLLNQMNESE